MKLSLQLLLVGLVAGVVAAAVAGVLGRRHEEAPLTAAHQVTVVATAAAAAAETVFVHDTVPLRSARAEYRAARDSAIAHPADTARATLAYAKADNALLLDSTAVASCARTIRAMAVQAAALRTELAISERLRAPRYRASSFIGADVNQIVPITGTELEVRVTQHWAIIGRVEKRWAAGEPTRRLAFVRYSL